MVNLPRGTTGVGLQRIGRLMPLLLLCLGAGSRWLLDDALPLGRSSLFSSMVGCLVAAVALAGLHQFTRVTRKSNARWPPVSDPRAWSLSAGAALLLVMPAVAGMISDRHINGNAATLAISLTPVVAAVSLSSASEGVELPGLLWPALAGTAGILLLLPIPDFSSWRQDVSLAAMPLVAGGMAVYLQMRLGAHKMAQAPVEGRIPFPFRWAARGLFGAACAFGLLSLIAYTGQERPSWSWAACFADGLLLFLSLWSLSATGAMRWSAQFLLTPLVTVLEGILLLRPTMTGRFWVGLLLLLLGGAYLLVQRDEAMAESHGELRELA